jgi:Mn-dependent DtxR family transcriptional regulator
MTVLSDRDKLDIFVALDNPLRINMLVYLSNNGGKAKNSDVAREFNLSRPDYISHLAKLQEGDLVEFSRGYKTDVDNMDLQIELKDKARTALALLLDPK